MEHQELEARRAQARARAQKRRRRKLWRNVAIAGGMLCLALALYLGWLAFSQSRQHKAGEGAYLRLAAQVTQTAAQATAGSLGGEAGPGPLVDLEALKALTEDAAGWLYCPDTPINYPLVQGTNNSYYMTRLPDGTKNAMGSLFVDYENRAFEDDNTIIYGHNMKNGAMFHSLLNYQQPGYYERHPTMRLTALSGEYTLELIAGFEITADPAYYQLNFPTFQDMEAYVASIQAMSDFASGITPRLGDKLVTLSTCAYGVADGRYLLVGRLAPSR